MLFHHYPASPGRYSVINFLSAFATALVAGIFALYLDFLGYSDVLIGYLFAIFPLVSMLGIPLIGRLADRIGKRRVLIYAIVAQVLGLIMYLLAGSFIFIVVGRVFDGLAATTLAIISLAKAEDMITAKRGERSGYFLSVMYLARVIAPPLGLVLADLVFIQIPFLVSLVFLAILLMLLLTTEEDHLVSHFRGELKYFSIIRSYLAHPRLRLLAAIGLVSNATAPALMVFLPLHLTGHFHLEPRSFAWAIFAFEFFHLFQFIFGRWSDHVKYPEWIILSVSAVGAVFLGLLGVATSYLQIILLLFVIGLSSAIMNVAMIHVLSEIGEKLNEEGMVMSTYFALARIGPLLSSIASGWIIYVYGFAGLTIASAALVVISCLLGMWYFVVISRNRSVVT